MQKFTWKSTVIVLSAFFIISGCEPQICCTNIDIGFNLSFVDQNGNDLLDPAHPNAITTRNIDLYYVVDGEMKKKSAPKYFSIITDEKLFDRYYMRVNPLDERENALITYLKFEDATMDTIKIQFRSSGNSKYVKKIRYNGELRWDMDDKSLREHPDNEYVGRYFTVTHHVD